MSHVVLRSRILVVFIRILGKHACIARFRSLIVVGNP
jgi:hypothetical protein